MDDRELEARLRARLHERFDAAQPTAELVVVVRQAMATQPRPVRFGTLRSGLLTVGWSPIAAAAFVALIAVAGLGVGSLMVPGDQGPSPTPGPTPVASAERWFITLPEFGATPTRAEIDTATDVLVTRLQTLGVQPIVEQTDPGVAFEIMTGDATSDAIRAVLGAVGDISFVPLPPEDYGQFGEGRVRAVIGEPLPTDPQSLFGWDGIRSVDVDDRGLLFTLNDTGRMAFASWSAAHVGETIAVIIDGRVALLPTTNEPIPGGEVLVSGGMDTEDSFAETAAILVGGRLPSAFGDVTSPAIVRVEDVIAATQRELPGANGLIWQLDAISEGGQWVPIWQVTFGGQFTPDCTPSLLGQACVVYTRLIATFDASNGVPIDREYQGIPGSLP